MGSVDTPGSIFSLAPSLITNFMIILEFHSGFSEHQKQILLNKIQEFLKKFVNWLDN